MKKWLLIGCSVFLTSCGGSSGGSGNDNFEPKNYDGIDLPVTFSSVETADDFYKKLYQYIYQYNGTVNNTARSNINTEKSAKAVSIRELQLVDSTSYGNCGGYMNMVGTIDDTTSEFDLEIDYSKYCDDDFYADGLVLGNGTLEDMTLIFQNTTYGKGISRFTISGSTTQKELTVIDRTTLTLITVDQQTLNLLMIDQDTNEQIQFENYIQITKKDFPYEKTENGTLYHSEYGRAEVETIESMIKSSYADRPSSGKLKFTGANSFAYITFYSSGYLVEVDTDGDGIINDNLLTSED